MADHSDAASPWRPVKLPPIPVDHPLLAPGPIVDLIATYGPDAGRPAPEAGPWAGLLADDLSWAARPARKAACVHGRDPIGCTQARVRRLPILHCK